MSEASVKNRHSPWVPPCAAGTTPWAAHSSPHLAPTTCVMNSNDHRLHTGGPSQTATQWGLDLNPVCDTTWASQVVPV